MAALPSLCLIAIVWAQFVLPNVSLIKVGKTVLLIPIANTKMIIFDIFTIYDGGKKDP